MFLIFRPTVTRKAKPHPSAHPRSSRLSSAICAMSGKAKISSEVTSKMIAVTASHKLRSDMVSGKIMLFHPKTQTAL
jgi:hypothetical protein